MSEEISVGVRIIVERCKTNPDEMTEDYGKWGQLRNAVFDTVENKLRGSAYLRGLTDEEITMLYEAFSSLHRKVFDDYVLKQVLGDEEKKEEIFPPAYLMAQGKRVQQAQMAQNIAQNLYSPYQNSISLQGNTVVQGTLDAEPSPAFLAKIKKGLGL